MTDTIKEQTLERTLTLGRMADDDARTVEIAFSSEAPYERSFGIEVLDHQRQSVRLDRLNGGAAVLVNHDSADQVGVVESARVDDDKVGRAVIRFSRSQRGEEIYQDVKDGIRSLVSVGYQVHDYARVRSDGEPDTILVNDWEPFEVSIVSIPADKNVGVGRSLESKQENKPEVIVKEAIMPEENKVEQSTESTAPAFDAEKELGRLRTAETKRADSIRSVADHHNLPELGREAISEGWSLEDFNKRALDEVGKRNNVARAESSHDGEVDLSKKDRERFSLLRLMEAIASPNSRKAQQDAAHELEVSAEAIRGFGDDFKARGEFVPTSLITGQRDLSAGTTTDGAELVGTDLLSGSYIDVLRNASATMQAGMRYLPGLVGNVDIPRQTSAAASVWISAEDGDASESEPQFDQVSLTPKDLACYTEVTRRLLQQSAPGIEGIVRNDLAVAQALGIDLAVLYGSGASGQPTGIANQTGVNTFNFAGADPTYAEIVRMIKEVMADNALQGVPMFIIEANGWEALSTTSKQGSGVEGNFILGDSDTIKGRPYVMSNQVTAEDYFFGDFSQAMLGEWGGLEINVDPYTHSLKGKIRYITFKTVDVAVRHPEAFCFCNDGA